ncbi:hypothetical protein [Endozoicomonas elysicola]|uniref:Uncharacterized protein n=1 Tax=Endozoicomonas elysicola TaxID=305900 RepID=A0A081K9T0_9GAMM|nr:hypothetical protein [Endozoicomonas elysicola]KEI70906.1 hypothetical protein GV64_09260 [Endozoicomonas elysicola]
MNIEPEKGVQHLPADVNPKKTNQAAYKNGKKLAPHKVGEPYQRADGSGQPLGRKLSERSISSLSDDGYGTDTTSISPDDEFSDTASITSESSVDSAISEDDRFTRNYCKNAESFINEASSGDKSHLDVPLFWTDDLVQELRDIAVIEGRTVTLDDYLSLNQEKNDALNPKEDIDRLFTQASLFELPLYSPEDIHERLDQLNHNLQNPKPIQQKKQELPERIFLPKGKEEKLLQYCIDEGIAKITERVYLQFDQQYKPDSMHDRQTALRGPITKETFRNKLKQLDQQLSQKLNQEIKSTQLPKLIYLSKGKEEKLLEYCIERRITDITDDVFMRFEKKFTPDSMKDRQTTFRAIPKDKFPKKREQLNQQLAEKIQSTRAAKAFKEPAGNQKLEKGLLAGAVAGAVASGASVAAASALQPPHDPSMFDHISPKDIPIDQIKIFAAHNTEAVPGKGSLPLLATNQNIDLEDMLDKTPIRGFDLDLHNHNGEIVINHGGIFDATVSDDNIPKLDNVLETMNDWLEEPGNHDEILFLNFENRGNLPWDALENAFGRDAVLDSYEYSNMVSKLGRAPTIEEIRAEGFKVVDFDHSRFIEAGSGEVGFHNLQLDSVWEDRTIMEHGIDMDLEFGKFSTDDIAPHITTDQIDEIMNTPGGKWVSLDQVSPNDPRFFKPEDRDGLALNPDLKLMGLFYESDEAFQSALLGFGTATAGATAALALAGGAYQGFLNEKKIRNQDKLMPGHLKAMELTAILQKRKTSKKHAGKPLGEKITLEEVKSLYKKNQLKTMTKDTIMAGASATVSLTGSALALGMLFPPLMPAFGGVSAGVAGTGTVATLLATVGNRKRLGKAIDEAFNNPGVLKALQERVDAMNSEIANCAKSSGDVDELLSSMVTDREKGERLLKASTVMLSTSLVARASGMSKYGMPALGTAAMGVGATITGVLVALSAAMNFRDRRSKLQNLSQTTSEVLRPDYGRKQKRKLGLFGDTAFQRFLKKNRTEVIKDLGLKPGCTNKEISFAFSLPGNETKLEYYLRGFAKKEWLKDVTAFANEQKPKQNFAEVRKDPEALKALLKHYAIKRVGDFAHNDTFAEGRSGTLKLALIGAFSGIFFLPMLGVAAGVLGIGLGVSKGVAVHERNVFTKKLTDLMDNGPGEDEEKIAAHNSLVGMIDSWTNMLADTPTAQPLTAKAVDTSPANPKQKKK